MSYLSRNWTVEEWDCYQRSENDFAHDVEGHLSTDNENTAMLFMILDALRDDNPDWVVNTTNAGYKSGYRTPEVNYEVGGVENSNHVYGCAADIHISSYDYDSEELADMIKDAAEALDLFDAIELGIYLDQGWCHLATPGWQNIYYES